MAFRKMRRFARRGFKKVKKYSKSNSESPLEIAAYSAVWGAARPYAANMMPDIPPLGAYSDNVVFGVLGYLAAKKGNGMIRKAGKVILINEAFIAGAKLSAGLTPSTSSNSDAVESN